jgi:hypothetical protein
MNAVSSELILSRTMAYLRAAELVTTREIEREALRLVEEALSDPGDDPMDYVMTRLAHRFRLPRLPAVAAAPPIHRGTIGYPNV